MKFKLHYMKLMTCAFLILPVISMLSLQAQDYLISFAGSGASTTVATVKIENLTQGTNLTMNGNDVLHLDVTVGIEPIIDNNKNKISFFPNPMKDYARMQFDLPETGETVITLYDLSGREIAQTRDLLLKGQHSYGIQGIEEGIFFIRISSSRYSFSGRLISSGSQSRNPKIVYENTLAAVDKKQSDSKSTKAETVMQYTTSDRLKFTGISGNYSTVITDIPTASKTITFNFIACTDGDNINYPIVQIGSQTWMAEDLKTTKYSNGDLIGTTEYPDKDIYDDISPKYQWAYNGIESNAAIYGRLYTYYAIIDNRNVCPIGWQVPTNDQWTIMVNYLIANGYNYDGTTTGNKIAKALASTTLWESSLKEGAIGNTDYPTKRNATGFTAVPGGYRPRTGMFNYISINCWYWSSTVNGTYVWEWSLGSTAFNNEISEKKTGFSVRCLKD